MSVVAFAYHDVGCAGIRVLRRVGIDVALVYTHRDDPAENRWYGSVAELCRELGVPCTTADPHLPEERTRIAAARPDALFSFYYRDMLKDSVLSLARTAAVNLHGSLLPRYRGRAPVNWMLLHGETRGGVTLHHMVRRADAGDIVDQEPFDIGPDDTPTDVYRKLLPAAERVLARSAAQVCAGTAPRAVQMESKATYHGRRRPEDGLIEWRWAAEDVRNLVRAVTKPYPGAFTFASGRMVTVWGAAHAPAASPSGSAVDAGAPPGTLLFRDGGADVLCGDGRLLRLLRVEIDGREGDPREFGGVLVHGLRLGGVEWTSSSSV